MQVIAVDPYGDIIIINFILTGKSHLQWRPG